MNGLLLADVTIHWFLPPLVVAISLVYSATRFESWSYIWPNALRWAVYILSFLICTNIFLYLLSLNLEPYLYIPLAVVAVALLFVGGRKTSHHPR